MKLLTCKKQIDGYSSATYLLWETSDHNLVESSILYIHGRSVPWVFCLPSSVGCRFGCRICAMPKENSPALLEKSQLQEIFEYSITTQRTEAEAFQVSFMGQGEPFLNTKNIFEFCSGLYKNFPCVTIGISTVGIADGIRALASEVWAKCVKLQLSLHCWPPEKREQIIPAERQYPVEKALFESIHFAKKWGRKCCLNCALLYGVNDSLEDAQHIAEIAANGPFYVKVSQFNPHSNCIFKPVSEEQVIRYCEIIAQNNIEVHQFRSIGTSIGAGCGQTKLVSERVLRDMNFSFGEIVNV